MQIPVVKPILGDQEELAQANRDRLGSVLAINLMASPGAGKTSLILATCERLRGRMRAGVVEGDVAATVDAELVSAAGLPVVQINTEGSCHLDAGMVSEALNQLPLDQLDLVFIENVGNLICPVSFDLGAHAAVLLASVPEGHDKPLKYPAAYARADAVVITKTDLAPWCHFERMAFERGLRALNPTAPLFALSCQTGEGFQPWIEWLLEQAQGGRTL